MNHYCHAILCSIPVPPNLFMCGPHWKMINAGLQALVWKYYRKGQEISKDPSIEYLFVVTVCQLYVAKKEYSDTDFSGLKDYINTFFIDIIDKELWLQVFALYSN